MCQHQAYSDTLIIEKIECKRTATGIDGATRAAALAVGAFIGAAATVATAGAAAPATATAAAGGGIAGAGASGPWLLDLIDGETNGQDDLIININGQKVYPNNGNTYYGIEQGQVIRPNIRFDFAGAARVQFIEYDSGSDNDNLGSFDVNGNYKPGENYRVQQAIIFNEDEGAMYYVDYSVERNRNGFEQRWIMCGTAACKSCGEPHCRKTSNYGLDRDGDKGDLRRCPPGFVDKGFKKYPQLWPFDDVFLRICASQ